MKDESWPPIGVMQDMFWDRPSEMLRMLLDQSSLSSKQLAEETGVASTSIRAFRNGQTKVMRADKHLNLVRYLLRDQVLKMVTRL